MENKVFVIYRYTNNRASEWYDPSAVALSLDDAVQYVMKHKGFKPPVRTSFKILAIKSGDEMPPTLSVEDSDQLNDECPSCKKPGIATDEDMWLCQSCKTKWPIESVVVVHAGIEKHEVVINYHM
ncbi:MAG: hypothetical protein JRM72_01315 [Nitrososphaerota archaeon]|nr:hypothetical protein [Nitrososphaerota archaeon]